MAEKKLPPFLIKLLGTKAFKFENGFITLMDVKGMFMTLQILALIQFSLEKKFNADVVKGILYDIGEIQAFMGTSQMTKRFGFKNNKETLLYAMQQSEMIGAGKYELVKADFQNKHFITKNINAPYAKEYRSIFGIQKSPSCDFLRGGSNGLVRAIIKEDVFTIEKQCASMNKSECIFETRPLKDFDSSDANVKKQLQRATVVGKDIRSKYENLNLYLKR